MKRTLNVYNNSPLKLISTCMSVPRQCHSLLESQSSPGPGWYHIYWGNRTPSSPTGSSLGSDLRPGRKSAVLLDLSSLWSYSRDFCIHLSYTEHIWSSFQFHCYIKEMHKIKNKFKQKQFTYNFYIINYLRIQVKQKDYMHLWCVSTWQILTVPSETFD